MLDIIAKGIVLVILSSQTYANERLYESISDRLRQM